MTASASLDLTTSILTNLSIRTLYRGEILFPCIPAALGSYVAHIDKLLRNLGQGFSPEQQEQVYGLLQLSMAQGFSQSPNAQIVFKYEVKGTADLQKTLSCEVGLLLPSLDEHYDTWYRQQQESDDSSIAKQPHSAPLFGQRADAKVLTTLNLFGDNAPLDILDIGAGEGRNAIPLAERGHRVHAIDLAPEFTAELERKKVKMGLSIEVSEADILSQDFELERDRYHLVVLSEVTSHFRNVDEMTTVFAKVSPALKSGGYLLLNCFLSQGEYEPDAMAIEMSQIAWSSLFTSAQLEQAIASLPLNLISDESVVEFEQAHLSAEHWPPTVWFEDWARGRSTFPFLKEEPPMELRWLLYQKS